jgi:hypothetical protein
MPSRVGRGARKDEDTFVFAAYNRQLRASHERSSRSHNALKVGS